MKISFAELPYGKDALEPHCSKRTVELHYDKHHRSYFDNAVKLIQGTKFEDMTLEEIIRATAKDPKQTQLFNNVAQVWNHDLFWRSIRPQGGGEPTGALREAIERDFGDFGELKKSLQEKAVKQFGSGWAWLVLSHGKLAVTSTSNAQDPVVDGATALLAIDVWEHAYYIDYQNRRPEFVETFLAHLVSWEDAAQRFDAAAEEHVEHVEHVEHEKPRRVARR